MLNSARHNHFLIKWCVKRKKCKKKKTWPFFINTLPMEAAFSFRFQSMLVNRWNPVFFCFFLLFLVVLQQVRPDTDIQGCLILLLSRSVVLQSLSPTRLKTPAWKFLCLVRTWWCSLVQACLIEDGARVAKFQEFSRLETFHGKLMRITCEFAG